MKKILLVVALVASAIGVGARAASATVCTLPNTLANGTVVDANALNGNFTSLQSCGNNIDSNNIGANGLFATQLKPLTSAQAIFGGTVAYSFANGLGVTGTLNAQAITATSLTSTGGVAVGGALTGATTGSFSGAVSTGALTATSLTATGLTTAGVVLNSAAGVLSSSAGPLPTALGGTGSATQNFVDLSTTQTIGGNKTFTNAISYVANTSGLLPSSGAGVLNQISSNASSGQGEVDFYKLYNAALSDAFRFYAPTATNATTPSLLSSINSNGAYVAGSSSYGATASSVAGTITGQQFTATHAVGSIDFQWPSSTSSGTTSLDANGGSVAGIAGTAMQVDNTATVALLTLSSAGSLGIAGSYFSASERRLKDHIAPFSDADLLRDLRATRIVRYAYRTEHAKHPTHIGFIADDTPTDLSPRHKSFDVNAVASTAFAAARYLERKVESLEAQIADLRHRLLPARVLRVAR